MIQEARPLLPVDPDVNDALSKALARVWSSAEDSVEMFSTLWAVGIIAALDAYARGSDIEKVIERLEFIGTGHGRE